MNSEIQNLELFLRIANPAVPAIHVERLKVVSGCSWTVCGENWNYDFMAVLALVYPSQVVLPEFVDA